MTEHILSLDYDGVMFDAMLGELAMLRNRYGIRMSLYSSSKNHYHIRTAHPIDEALAWEIMASSRCSDDYKEFCKTVNKFPIRNSEKIYINSKGEKFVSPKPIKLLTI